MKNIIKNFIKISILSMIFIFLVFIIQSCNNNELELKKENNIKSTKKSNSENYHNINIKSISHVAIAIATNIGTKNTNDNLKVNINKEIFSVNDFYINSNNIKSKLIKTNMIFTKEYLNIVKLDLNKIIKKSENKGETVNKIIKQLKIRYNNANTNLKTLNKQRSILLSEYEKNNSLIESLKKKLEIEFTKSNTQEVLEIVDKYYELKNKQIYLKTNIIFINEFVKRYQYLNKYNSITIETLINNKDIISKNSYIVIPKSGDQLLRKFDLLFSEEEFKKLKTEK